MASYAEYVEQIAKLQSLAETARKDEINGAIQKIKELMQLHGVTVADLSSGTRAKPAKAKGTVAAQFKSRAPRWLAGQDKEQFRITN
jgi:DNA-binding protein H-NS